MMAESQQIKKVSPPELQGWILFEYLLVYLQLLAIFLYLIRLLSQQFSMVVSLCLFSQWLILFLRELHFLCFYPVSC